MDPPKNPLDAALARIERQARTVRPIARFTGKAPPLSEEAQRRQAEAFNRARQRLREDRQ